MNHGGFMNQEQQAYESGYYVGYQRAADDLKAVIGPRFFNGNPSIQEAMRRRERFMFWVRFGVEMVIALPGLFIFWLVLQYAHDLQERCSQCICITRTK